MVDVAVGADFGDLTGHCAAQDPPRKPDLSQQVCLIVFPLQLHKATKGGEKKYPLFLSLFCVLNLFYSFHTATGRDRPRVRVPNQSTQQ